jgi:hypothetical protein
MSFKQKPTVDQRAMTPEKLLDLAEAVTEIKIKSRKLQEAAASYQNLEEVSKILLDIAYFAMRGVHAIRR